MKNFYKLASIFFLSFSANATDLSLFGVDASISGFGSAGFAISNKPYKFERVIDDNGTFARNSLVGAQLDLKFTDEIGATIQGKVAPSKDSASWAGILNWGFISWRPSNDLLFRFGKQRIPLYLFSETMDIGVTYDFEHLPTEMYSTAPNSDYLGASFSKTWNIDLGELTLDGYLGRSDTSLRIYQRDNVSIPIALTKFKSNYTPYTMDAIGTVLTLQRDEDKYRASFTYVDAGNIENGAGFSKTETLVPASYFVPKELAPVFQGSAYTILPSDYTQKAISLAFTFGSEIKLPYDFRVLTEYAHREILDFTSGLSSNGGYISLLKEIDGWTPYVSFAMLQSNSDVLELYQAVNTSKGISAIPLAAKIPAVKNGVKMVNASQRVIADYLLANDQHTIAIGSAYSLTPTQKLKFEWTRTRVGINSSFVDAPSGSTVDYENIDVFSFLTTWCFRCEENEKN